MGTAAHLVLHADDEAVAAEALDRAEGEARAIESRFSRFLDTSELSSLNAADGSWFEASSELRAVLALAQDLHRETAGLFDPAILPALERAGYDTSFEHVAPREEPLPAARREGSFTVEIVGDRVRLGPGLRIDLGGIVKGWAADRIADDLAAHGPALVDLGGDCALRGDPPEGCWIVAIERSDHAGLTGPVDPADAADAAQPGGEQLSLLGLGPGAVATSGTNRRRWRTSDRWSHHLIDPRTGASAATDLVQVTALHSSAAQAEVWAKAALIAGGAAAMALVERVPGLELVIVPSVGTPLASAGAVAAAVRGSRHGEVARA